MDVKEAVVAAKQYVAELFSEESILNLGLEEVELQDQTWVVTLGFSRPWDAKLNALIAATHGGPRRSFKTVKVSDTDGRVISVKDRILAPQ